MGINIIKGERRVHVMYMCAVRMFRDRDNWEMACRTMNDGKPMQPGQSLYSEAQGDTSSVFKDPQFVDMKPQTLQRVQETGLDTENLADVSEGVRASSDGGSKL